MVQFVFASKLDKIGVLSSLNACNGGEKEFGALGKNEVGEKNGEYKLDCIIDGFLYSFLSEKPEMFLFPSMFEIKLLFIWYTLLILYEGEGEGEGGVREKRKLLVLETLL